MASNEEKFIKYSSINNSYNTKYMNYHLNRNPQLSKELFIMQHKYDGSNFQIIFHKSGQIKYASRNKLLEENEKFFGYKNYMPKLAQVIKNVQNYLENSTKETINLFGELYGSAVIKRIKYEKDSPLNVKFFDVYFDDSIQTPKTFYEWVKEIEIPDEFLVETFGEPALLEDCLKFNTESIRTKCDDKIEGVVIKPYSYLFTSVKPSNSNEVNDNENNNDDDDDEGYLFYLKLKNPAFVEVENIKVVKVKEKEEKVKTIPLMSQVETEFDCYVNENRVLNNFGKQEWTKKDTKLFYDFVMNDALKDFFKDLSDAKFNEIIDREIIEKVKKHTELSKKANELKLPSKLTTQKLFQLIKTNCNFK